jgi:hypothetical protein
MTIRFATDPSTVRFPARVEGIAGTGHARLGSERCGTSKAQDIERNHQAGADNRRAGAIHAESGQSPQREHKIGASEYECRSKHDINSRFEIRD